MKTKTFLVFLLTAVSGVMLCFRMFLTQNIMGIGLAWNLFLAWLPLFVAKYMELRQSQLSNLGILIWSVIWLLFFPNAPYLITDLIHLKTAPDHLLWYDSLMTFSFALAGLLTGLYSMLKVHRVLARRWSQFTGWSMMGLSAVLSSYGIYLGRYGRWNSWDIITQPWSLLKYSYHNLNESLAIQTTLAFSFVLGIIYIAFWLYAHVEPRLDK